MSVLLAAVRAKDEELAHHWSKTEEWGTVQQLMSANCELYFLYSLLRSFLVIKIVQLRNPISHFSKYMIMILMIPKALFNAKVCFWSFLAQLFNPNVFQTFAKLLYYTNNGMSSPDPWAQDHDVLLWKFINNSLKSYAVGMVRICSCVLCLVRDTLHFTWWMLIL